MIKGTDELVDLARRTAVDHIQGFGIKSQITRDGLVTLGESEFACSLLVPEPGPDTHPLVNSVHVELFLNSQHLLSIKDCLAGLADTRPQGVVNAVHRLCHGTLPPLMQMIDLKTFAESEVTVKRIETAVTGGGTVAWTLFLGPLQSPFGDGPAPELKIQPIDVLTSAFTTLAEENLLSEKRYHWMRIFHSRTEAGRSSACVFDSIPWKAANEIMEATRWLDDKTDLIFRQFAVLKPESFDPHTERHWLHEPLNAFEIVEMLISTIAGTPDSADDDWYQRLCKVLDRRTVEDAMNMSQIAFSRVILQDLELQWSDDYLRFDSDGNIAEQGEISTHPLYLAARELAPGALESRAIVQFAASSAEFNAVNNALNEGQKPEDLKNSRFSPAAFLAEGMTDEGFSKVAQFLNDFVQTTKAESGKQSDAATTEQKSEPPKKKPWYQFWG